MEPGDRQLNRHVDALKAYDEVLTIRSDQAGAWLGRADAYYRLKRFNETLAAYNKALAIKRDLAEAWHGLGVVLGELVRYDESLVAFDTALALRPGRMESWLGRALCCYHLKRYNEALPAYDRVLALKPDCTAARLGRANACLQLKRFEEAVADYDKALALNPDLAEAWLGRGEALHELGHSQEAIAAFRQALAKGGDAEAIQFTLASLGAEVVPATAPRPTVTELFDRYADYFDEHMVGTLKYRGPELLLAAMLPFLPSSRLDILDLGCGTGLLGVRIRPLARTMTGVDFSANMLKRARQRQIYDSLVCAELTEFLPTQIKAFDLVVATDVFIYVGDLAQVFQGVRGALRERGIFGFSVEIGEERDLALQPSRRYAHSAAYLRKLAEEHGFILETMEPHTIREHDGSDLPHYITVMSRA
jgi:predicted TPR repeat methyltransferase